METLTYKIIAGIFISLASFNPLGSNDVKAKSLDVDAQRAIIHVCDASWFLWYEQARDDGCSPADARAWADQKRVECFQNYQ